MQEIYQLRVFNWLDKNIIDSIINNSTIEKFHSWDVIIMEWDSSNWKWYIIKSWLVSVEIWGKEVAQLWKWEIFWEIALLNEEKRTATVKSITDVETIIISQENIFEMINNWNDTINKDIMHRLEQNLINNLKYGK